MPSVFPPITHAVPSAIGVLSYEFTDPNGTVNLYTATASVNILDSTGRVIATRRIANLIPHITTAERNGLIALFGRLRTLAATELLP